MSSIFGRLFQKDHGTSNTPKPAFGLGDVVNQRYRLEAEIGRGGMGIIYRAYDLAKNRKVAFKVIHPETANALSLGQFAREAEILSRLYHPHIVSLFETGFVNDDLSLPFLVMEFLQGLALSEAGTLTYPRIVSVAKQVCEALEYIHRQGYVYRDLKPNNILLEKRGFDYFVKLVDSGLARLLGEDYLPNESSLAGTVFYLAPELADGLPANIASDLYALGILLYEMLVGRVPFSDVDEATIRLQHQQQKAPPPGQSRSNVPPEIDSLVLRLLEKNPSARPASAQEVLEILKAIRFDKLTKGNLPPNIPNETDIQPVVQLLGENSIITFTDNDMPLALSAASQLAGQFSDGVWVIDLENMLEPSKLLSSVYSTLGVTENPNRPPVVTLIEFLREKNLLLLLAHCGHISGACAQFASAIISSCPDVRILAVSEHAFGLPSEVSIKG